MFSGPDPVFFFRWPPQLPRSAGSDPGTSVAMRSLLIFSTRISVCWPTLVWNAIVDEMCSRLARKWAPSPVVYDSIRNASIPGLYLQWTASASISGAHSRIPGHCIPVFKLGRLVLCSNPLLHEGYPTSLTRVCGTMSWAFDVVWAFNLAGVPVFGTVWVHSIHTSFAGLRPSFLIVSIA